MDEAGQVEGEWSSLVDPGRDVGPTSIHGIAAREILSSWFRRRLALAASFRLRQNGRSTQRPFDVRFLRVELARSGYSWTGTDIPALCTMELAGRYVRSSSRKLTDCCRGAASSTLASLYAPERFAACSGERPDLAVLRPEPAQIRRKGFVVNEEASERDLVAVGCVVRRPDGTPVAGISVSAPSPRYECDRLPTHVTAVREAASTSTGR